MKDENLKLLLSLLAETGEIIDSAIIRYTRVQDTKLQEIINYSLMPKGSRERPFLVRLSCEAIGGNFTDIIPAAVAVELFHFSTLIVDDILDNSPLRGGSKSVFKIYGDKYAIIVAELMNSLAFLALTDLYSTFNDSDRILTVVNVCKETQRDLYYGQYLDLFFEHNKDIKEEQYIDMILKTTASLIKCSLMTGTILGGGNEEDVRILRKYGESLGIAFQIRDDLVEIIEDPEIVGKQLGGDIKQGKMRLPHKH